MDAGLGSVQQVFNQLVANDGNARRFMFEQAVVSDGSGNFTFFFLSAEAKGHARPWRDWFDGVGSLDRSHVVTALGDQAEHLERFILEIRVPVVNRKCCCQNGPLRMSICL